MKRPSVPAQIVWTVAALACALPGIAAHASPSLEDEVMLAAAREGNVALFRAMIKAGANAHVRDDSGNNALVFAALSDQRRDAARGAWVQG